MVLKGKRAKSSPGGKQIPLPLVIHNIEMRAKALPVQKPLRWDFLERGKEGRAVPAIRYPGEMRN